MKVQTIISSMIAATAALYLGSVAQATQLVNIAISTVGNAGNAADPTTSYGSVGYTFGIGTYDVTLTQYTAFLNAVAATDTYGLYNPHLATDTDIAGISRSGASGSYAYSVMGDGQRPVTYVSWLDAARFTNWLSNGQPTGAQGNGTTEMGAYTLNGDTASGLETKNSNAQWYIPSEDEWYKAAYYDPNQGGLGVGGYWSYATRSNTAPGNVLGSGANEANYWNGTSYTLSGVSGYLTDVGAFANSASAYGTYDQSGDVYEWNNAVISSSCRGLLGGCWDGDSSVLQSSLRNWDYPTVEYDNTGFRVATSQVPEPSSVILIGLGAAGLALLRRRRSKF